MGAGRSVDPDSLPLSTATRARLQSWASIPDAKLAEHISAPQDITWTAEEKRTFEAEGRELWRMLQRELGRDYYVVYHSTAAGRILSPEDETVS
jgi:hypothetical protein